ncbi:MAG: cysteine desulfurase NifS [Candidatus Marinimicrobia bacterium]|nr:cysteine desulfurase NifS [Candidatus Neomarinimicrobiota bacterium]
MAYFDHSATTPIHNDVLEQIHEIQTKVFGNPSSNHDKGRQAKSIIEKARDQVSSAIGASPNQILFTSGGTESNNQLLYSMIGKAKNHIITSKIEHPAILETLANLKKFGIQYDTISVDNEGTIIFDEIQNFTQHKTGLISIMLANNEVGTIQPIKNISEYAKSRDILTHTDAVQCLGKIPIDVKELGVDFLSLSAHKFYGPKGVGILFANDPRLLESYIFGGSQEYNLRGGTENTAAIAGMGLAAQITTNNLDRTKKHLENLESFFKTQLKNNFPEAKFNENINSKLPGLISVSFPKNRSNILLSKLDRLNFAVSNGSACGSGIIKPSKILSAMGVKNDLNLSTIRISFGTTNTLKEIKSFLAALDSILVK